MIATLTNTMTADEFWEWASLPENSDKRFELERGRVVETPPPGERHGGVCAWVAHLLWVYVLRLGRGRVIGNDSGLLVETTPDTLRGPDLMLFLESRSLDELSQRYATDIPTLIVEVLSPRDRLGEINRRIGQYLKRGVPLVWVLDPDAHTVSVGRPGKEMYTLDETEELTGDNILPEWRCPVADIFTLPGEIGSPK
jgi:Uma2 family endonuclease